MKIEKTNLQQTNLINYLGDLDKIESICKNHNFNLSFNNNNNPYLKGESGINYYNYTFTIDNKKFTYSEGIGHNPLNDSNKLDKIINALYCLLLDYYCYSDYTLDDFIKMFSYEYLEGKKIYNTCLKNANKLDCIFTSDEIETLKENINL